MEKKAGPTTQYQPLAAIVQLAQHIPALLLNTLRTGALLYLHHHTDTLRKKFYSDTCASP